MEEEIIEAEIARRLSFETNIKRLDQAVEEAITDGMTEVHLKISTYIDTNRVLVENIERVVDHFDAQHYQIKYRCRDEQVTHHKKV